MDSGSSTVIARYMVLVVLLAIALYFDIKENKIKNFITIPAALIGFLINLLEYGTEGLLTSCMGLLIPMALLMVFYFINVMGAGDIKLFAAIGAIMGLPFAINSIVLSVCFGAAISILLLVRRRQFMTKIKKVYYYFFICYAARKLILYTSRGNNESKFPFTMAIVPAVSILIFLTGPNMEIY